MNSLLFGKFNYFVSGKITSGLALPRLGYKSGGIDVFSPSLPPSGWIKTGMKAVQ